MLQTRPGIYLGIRDDQHDLNRDGMSTLCSGPELPLPQALEDEVGQREWAGDNDLEVFESPALVNQPVNNDRSCVFPR